jgi:hypothetical protein
LAETEGDLPGVIVGEAGRVAEPFIEAVARHKHWART